MSNLPVRLSKDRSGRPRAAWKGTAPEAGEFLIEWLESDLQDQANCANILANASKIVEAKTGSWKTSGNAFSVLVGPRRVLLTPLFGLRAKPFRMATPELIAVVEAWKALV